MSSFQGHIFEFILHFMHFAHVQIGMFGGKHSKSNLFYYLQFSLQLFQIFHFDQDHLLCIRKVIKMILHIHRSLHIIKICSSKSYTYYTAGRSVDQTSSKLFLSNLRILTLQTHPNKMKFRNQH